MAPNKSQCIYYLVIHLFTISGIHGALRPRGVSLPKKVFYNANQKFNCLDGSGTFPFYFVNDDFCDCKDGSDEPGTSACDNGVFHCLNHGHVSRTLPSSRVNDEICDCCDTSDEYNSTADCLNNCKELGHGAYLAAQRFKEFFMRGHEIRNEYIKQGKEKKESYKSLLEDLYKQEQEAMKIKNDKQDEKEYAETRENSYLGKERELKKAHEERLASERKYLQELQQQEDIAGKKAFLELDVNKDGKLTTVELKSFNRFDYDQDGIISDNEAQFYMHMKEEMSEQEFLQNGWKVMKPAFMMEENEPPTPVFRSDVDRSKSSQDLHPESLNPSLTLDRSERDDILKDAAVTRQNYADADKLLRDIQAEIWHLRSKIDADFGEEDEFLVLEGQCFEFSEKRYMYKFCPFDKIVQVVKVNQDETLVGLWEKWAGPPDEHYSLMRFMRGTSCWNGPNRSADVAVRCGVENAVVSVVESSPCAYSFEFVTPAMCRELPNKVRDALDRDMLML